MPRFSIYLPDDLHDEIIERVGDSGNVSRFIRQAVDTFIEPSRPYCECGRKLAGGWAFCPDCGRQHKHPVLERALWASQRPRERLEGTTLA